MGCTSSNLPPGKTESFKITNRSVCILVTNIENTYYRSSQCYIQIFVKGDISPRKSVRYCCLLNTETSV